MTARLLVITVGLLALGAPARPQHQNSPPGFSRLRVLDRHTNTIVRLGLEWSPTLRELIAGVETGRDFVFVGVDNELPPSLAGRMTLMGVSGQYRYLRISIGRSLSPVDAVAALAHELQHVREVRDNPDVRDDEALAALYRRIGHQNHYRGPDRWDTVDAQRVGRLVRREISPAMTAAKAVR